MNPTKRVGFPLAPLELTDEIYGPILPQSSRHSLLKWFLTPLRRAAWKLFGLYSAFEHSHSQIMALRQALAFPRFFHFRPNSEDRDIFVSVVICNEYELPDSFHPNDIILDIGAHIGSFCYAVLSRGCRHVYGFEAGRDNYNAAAANLRPFGDQVRLFHCAVWRSDRKGDQLFAKAAAGYNTGGDSLFFHENGQPMEVLALDDILRDITRNGQQRVRLLKIDCEGSEYPILLTSSQLHLIDEIRGEYHEINDGVRDTQPIPAIARVGQLERFTMPVLAEALERAGFEVRSTRVGNLPLGHFIATRGLNRLHDGHAAA